jgi:hypothetical protein
MSEPQFAEKMKVAYPMAEEEQIDFLNRCRFKNSEVILCPRCNSVFDKEATKGLEGFIPKSKKRGKWSANHRQSFLSPRVTFLLSVIPRPLTMLIRMVKAKLLCLILKHLFTNLMGVFLFKGFL